MLIEKLMRSVVYYKVSNCTNSDCLHILNWETRRGSCREVFTGSRELGRFLMLVQYWVGFFFFFKLIEIYFTLHTIYKFTGNNSVMFRLFTDMCKHHHSQFYFIYFLNDFYFFTVVYSVLSVFYCTARWPS